MAETKTRKGQFKAGDQAAAGELAVKTGPPYAKGDPRAREAGRKGGKVSSGRRWGLNRPYEGTIIDLADAAGLTGPSWAPWRVFLKATDGLPLSEEELVIFRRHTERETPPTRAVGEAVMPVGRRGGKTRVAAVKAAHRGIIFDPARLAPGETAVVMILAPDRRQSRQCLGYLRGIFELEEFKPYVGRVLKESIELRTGVTVEIQTASYRSVRGYTTLAAICDEIAFWRNDDGSANPDTEVLGALRPSMATVADAQLLMLSSPYAARGELFRAVERSWGRDDPNRLVWNSDSRSMNPSLPAETVELAFEEDPIAAASEYGSDGRVQFRRDVEAFLDAAAIKAVTATGCREIAPQSGVTYRSFVDPSGGAQDSFTLAVAHDEGDTAVLDAVRERRPPFSPDDVVKEYAELLKTYRVSVVVGDRYAGEFPRELFRKHGIKYEPSERTKSDIYRELTAPVNAGRVSLLDLPVLRVQLLGLERRVARGGKDSIDHGPSGRDDVANAAAGALVLGRREQPRVNLRILGR